MPPKPDNKKAKKVIKQITKKPLKDKTEKVINVPVMRSSSQLKEILNKNTYMEKNTIYEENPNIFSKIKEYNTIIRKSSAEEKEKLQKEFIEFKNKNKDIIQKEKSCKRKEYRISGNAQKLLSVILEFIIRDMLKYGISLTASNDKGTKTLKVQNTDYINIKEEGTLISFPLINNLKVLLELKDKKEDKKEDKEEDKEEKKIKSPTYKMVVQNIFKQLNTTDSSDKKISCSGTCKQFISNILMEVVDRFSFYLSEIVGNNSLASTINDKHIYSICRILFYNSYRNLDQYSKFYDDIQELLNNRFKK